MNICVNFTPKFESWNMVASDENTETTHKAHKRNKTKLWSVLIDIK